MSNIVAFTGQRATLYAPRREDFNIRGKARERWCVLAYKPDGECIMHRPLKDKATAEWLASVLAEADANRRAAEQSSPLVQAIKALPEPYRHAMIQAMRRQFGGGIE